MPWWAWLGLAVTLGAASWTRPECSCACARSAEGTSVDALSETTPPLAEARVVASDEASTARLGIARLEASTQRLGIARFEASTARLRTARPEASTARLEAARLEGLLPTGCIGDCGDECPDGGCPEGCPGCASDGLGTSAAAMPMSATGWPEPATTTPRATAPGFYVESLAASGVRADVFRPPRA